MRLPRRGWGGCFRSGMARSLPHLAQSRRQWLQGVPSRDKRRRGSQCEARRHHGALHVLEPAQGSAQRALSATMSTPARSAACSPTRSCSISTRGADFRSGSPDRGPMRSSSRSSGAAPSSSFGATGDRKELDSLLHCVADEAQPFLIGAEARPPRPGGGGHRGYSPAASSPRADPCARSRRLRRPCRAAVDRTRRRRRDDADLAAHARSPRAPGIARPTMRRRPLGFSLRNRAQALQAPLRLFRRTARTNRHWEKRWRVTAP